jgi:CheY-like chemotaxis protein
VPSNPIFGNWLVAIAEAAGVTGARDLEAATLGQMTKAWGLVSETAGLSLDELTERVAEQAHIGVARLADSESHAALLLPSVVAHRRMVLPMRCDEREIVVATANPLSQETKREIAALSGRRVLFEAAAPGPLAEAIDRAYGTMTPAEIDAEPRMAPTDLRKGPRILVVDDEVGQRALFRSVLEDGGYRVDLATDGAAAVAMLRDDAAYDLVTLDYWMDRMNGLRVLQQIRSTPATRALPVIMVTGADDRQIEMSLFEAGADDFIAKPIDAPLFLLRIQAVLRRRLFT